MLKESKTVSPLLYYILVSGVTNLVFIAVGAIALPIFLIKLPIILINVILVLLIWKEVVIVFLHGLGIKRPVAKNSLWITLGNIWVASLAFLQARL
ncbi:MAG: hypothetical protein PVF83_09985 [Anaerolineales bacterium]|jgi:hypothetical protein